MIKSNEIYRMASYTIPAWDLDRPKKTQVRQECIQALARTAEYYYLDLGRLVFRSLLPQDVGLENWKTVYHSSWINHCISDSNVLSLYGLTIVSDNPNISGLKISSNGTVHGIHDITHLRGVLPIIKSMATYINDQGMTVRTFGSFEEIKMEAYITPMLIFSPNDLITIELLSDKARSPEDEYLVIHGFIAEPRGRTIDPYNYRGRS